MTSINTEVNQQILTEKYDWVANVSHRV